VRAVLAAAWRGALAEDPGRFADIAEHPATVRALADAHVALRDLTTRARAEVASASPVTGQLVTMHEAVVRRIEGGWYDGTDLLSIAAERAGAAGPGQVVLYLPQLLTRAETSYVEALAGAADLTVIAALTGTARADGAVHRTLDRLGAGGPGRRSAAERPPVATADQVINASDSDDEVRCVVRDVVDSLKTAPAHRIAVLYAAATPYARLLHEQLAAAGITINGAGVRTAEERAVARILLEVLALHEHDLPRADLFRAVTNAPTRDFTGQRIPVSAWERLSREAGVVSGDDWLDRLGHFGDDLRARAAKEATSAEQRSGLIARSERRAAEADRLRDFAGRLRAELQRAAGLRTWRDLAAWCLSLFTTLVGPPAEMTRLPSEEQYAAATLVLVLRSLEQLDAVEPSASFAALRDVLALELAGSRPRVGRFGEGVLVAPMSAAIGLDLDIVYVIGLSEDLYPARVQPDALLPDRARAASGGELPDARERLHTRYRHLLAAFAAAPRSVAAFPRGDLRRSTRRLPSRWLLPSLRELAGDRTLPATQWEQVACGDALMTAASYAGELGRTGRLATDQEWRTREIVARGRLDDAAIISGVAMIRARTSDARTRYDGRVGAPAGLPDYAAGELVVAPTTLESYAECPHSYFVERLLGVRPIEQPEDLITISPLTIGNLVHESFAALVEESGGDLPDFGARWSGEQRVRLIAIMQDKAAEYERRGRTGHPRLWEREQLRILRVATDMLDDDDAWRADHRAKVLASEMPFGGKGQPPVEIAVPGGRIRMRGSADKVDIGADGTIYVTDIKTGSDRNFKGISKDDPLVRGSKLQLPVYAYAAREKYGHRATDVQASYWFVRRGLRRITVDLTDDVEREYARTLGVLVTSITAGVFPLRAPDEPDFLWVQCNYCNPDGIGHAAVRERWERKRLDPGLRDYVALVDSAAPASAR
ncbi:MAG: PD-(D/E)XK nuclease family protein, partial [Mycobacteriales bacterium]